MATYTDERLLDSAGAVALLPHLPIDMTETEATSGRKPTARTVTPNVTPGRAKRVQNVTSVGNLGGINGDASKSHKTKKPREKRGFDESGGSPHLRTTRRLGGHMRSGLSGRSSAATAIPGSACERTARSVATRDGHSDGSKHARQPPVLSLVRRPSTPLQPGSGVRRTPNRRRSVSRDTDRG